jgi:lipooligosaccharide transport system ATP-binding protein
MDEAEQLCDRLVVMDRGRIVAEGSPRDLIEAHSTKEVLELRFDYATQDAAIEKLKSSSLAGGAAGRNEVLPDRILVYATDGEAALASVHGMSLSPLTALVRRATLEDVFLKLTGRSLID